MGTAIGGFLLGSCTGVLAGGGTDTVETRETPGPTTTVTAADPEREQELAAEQLALEQRAAELDQREAALAPQEAAAASATVSEGIWTVGRDIEPGTYRTVAAAGADCYWGIYVSGSNGSDIVDNGIPGGGFPQVTLSEGQDFETRRCGEWAKQ